MLGEAGLTPTEWKAEHEADENARELYHWRQYQAMQRAVKLTVKQPEEVNA